MAAAMASQGWHELNPHYSVLGTGCLSVGSSSKYVNENLPRCPRGWPAPAQAGRNLRRLDAAIPRSPLIRTSVD